MIQIKIIRYYIITVIVCLSITALTACVFVADENARKISLGQEFAVVVMNTSAEKYYDSAVNALPVIEKIKNGAKRAASIAPPPLSNIYWIIVNSEKEEI